MKGLKNDRTGQNFVTYCSGKKKGLIRKYHLLNNLFVTIGVTKL